MTSPDQITGRPDIDAAVARLRVKHGSKREIRKLPEFLWEGESVEMLAGGNYGGGAGLLAMTDRRLLFLKHGFMSQTLEDFPYSRISSVQWHSGMLLGSLVVFASGNKAEITNMAKSDGKALADKLRDQVSQGSATEAPAGGAGAEVARRLATLDQLRAAGAITDGEYQDRRSAILAGI
jgi:hypothetical protein